MIQKYVKEDLTGSYLRLAIATGYQNRAEPLAAIACKTIAACAGEWALLSVTGQRSDTACCAGWQAHLIPSTYAGLLALNISVRLFTSTVVANFVLKRFFFVCSFWLGQGITMQKKQMITVGSFLSLGKQAIE